MVVRKWAGGPVSALLFLCVGLLSCFQALSLYAQYLPKYFIYLEIETYLDGCVTYFLLFLWIE